MSIAMNCPNCGAPMRLDEDKDFFNCDYCVSTYFPQKNEDGIRVLGEPAALSCPLCAVPLVHAALSGCRIMYCTRCRGALIKMAVFVELLQARRAHGGGLAARAPGTETRKPRSGASATLAPEAGWTVRERRSFPRWRFQMNHRVFRP